MDLIKLENYDLLNTIKSFFVNLPPKTAHTYFMAIKDFFSYLTQSGLILNDFKLIKRYHIISYKEYLIQKGLSNNTVLKKLAAISSMCKFLAAEDLIDKDVIYGIVRPKVRNKCETGDFSDEEVKKIFESLDPNSKYFYSHRAMLAVGFYTGFRSSEIRNIKLSDYGKVKGHQIIRATTKGDKVIEIPINPFAVNCIDEHIENMKRLGFQLCPEHYLFPSMKTKQNKPIRSDSLWGIIKKRIEKAGIKKAGFIRLTTHSMRATFAGHLLNSVKAPLENVQRLMGHNSPITTQRYNKRLISHDKSPIYQINY